MFHQDGIVVAAATGHALRQSTSLLEVEFLIKTDGWQVVRNDFQMQDTQSHPLGKV